MCNKLRVQEHLDTTVKLAMGLAIPLMSLLMRVLAMMMRVADMEEVDTLQSVVQQMVLEKRQQEKGHKGLTKENMQMHKDFKPSSRKKSNSTGSFSVVTAETLDTLMSHQSRDMIHPRATSSNRQVKPSDLNIDQCYCGLKPVKYTCRKQGINYLRQFLRCPKEPQSPSQCHFFLWLQETKGEEYERMYATSPKAKKQPNISPKSVLHSTEELTSCEEVEEISPNAQHRRVRGSPRSSDSPPTRTRNCQHQWNKRGTNAHIKMRTCTLCGLQEITNRKTEMVEQRRVDVTQLKKSGRPRAVSP
jgi:hypothetical protein